MGRKTLTPDDVVYNDLPMYHVGGAHFNVVRALWTGASVSLWDRFSPNDFWRRVKETGCTTAVLLDVMTPWLLNAEPTPDDRRNPLNKVHMQPLPAGQRARPPPAGRPGCRRLACPKRLRWRSSAFFAAAPPAGEGAAL